MNKKKKRKKRFNKTFIKKKEEIMKLILNKMRIDFQVKLINIKLNKKKREFWNINNSWKKMRKKNK